MRREISTTHFLWHDEFDLLDCTMKSELAEIPGLAQINSPSDLMIRLLSSSALSRFACRSSRSCLHLAIVGSPWRPFCANIRRISIHLSSVERIPLKSLTKLILIPDILANSLRVDNFGSSV